jgi:lipopolysaccharide assembly protein A
MRYVQGFLLLIFLGAVAIFALQNREPVELQFLSWSLRAPLALEVVAVYLLGMVSGWTVVAFVRRSIHRVTRER